MVSLQVLTTIEKEFSDSFIKEHLILAVSSMDSSEQPVTPLLAKVCHVGLRSPDIHTSLHCQ